MWSSSLLLPPFVFILILIQCVRQHEESSRPLLLRFYRVQAQRTEPVCRIQIEFLIHLIYRFHTTYIIITWGCAKTLHPPKSHKARTNPSPGFVLIKKVFLFLPSLSAWNALFIGLSVVRVGVRVWGQMWENAKYSTRPLVHPSTCLLVIISGYTINKWSTGK